MQVKRVFVNKLISSSDSVVDEKAGWKDNSGFYINRTINYPGKPALTSVVTVGWNNR